MPFKRINKLISLIVILLIVPLFFPFNNTVNAYGLISNHEKVVDIGKGHFVVLKEDGSVWTWGDNSFAQLGAGILPPYDSQNPIPVQKADGNRLSNITAIAVGGYHTVALDKDGTVWTWGWNYYGQLGHSSGSLMNENPATVKKTDGSELSNIVAIAAGDYHTLAVDVSGQVWSWGQNAFGQLGVSGGDSVEPIQIPTASLTNIVAVSAGSEHSVALNQDGTVWTWGRNSSGQLGNGETTNINYTPRKVPSLNNVMEISAGANHTLALDKDQTTIWAWGSNFYGQLGDGGKEDKLVPIKVKGMNDVTMISSGDNHSIALKEDGTVWAWGRYTSGGDGASRSTPIQIQELIGAIAIGGGGEGPNSHILTIKQDGTVWAWNKDYYDTTTSLPIFKQVPGIDGVMKLDEFPFVQGNQVLFRYYGDASSVKVYGSFNDWIEIPLEEISNNVWELQIPLKQGEYMYGFHVNGRYTLDPLNRNKTYDIQGSPYSVLKVLPYAEESPIINSREVTFTYSSYDDNEEFEFDAQTKYVAVRGDFGDNWDDELPMEKLPNNTWALTLKLEPGNHYYEYWVRDRRSGAVGEKRLDPQNPNVETNTVTQHTFNKFHVSEYLPITIPVQSVSLNKGPELDLIVGEQKTILATISPSNATNKNVSWSSSKPEVVTVDASGKLTAHSEGEAVIVCAADNQKTATITVIVHKQDNAVSYPRADYNEFTAPQTGVSTTKVWKVSFSTEMDKNSFVPDSVYILNESGIKVPLAYNLLSDEKTLEIRLADGYKYSPGATYYLFVEKTVKSKYGKGLNKPAQMKFTIKVQ